MTRTDLRSSNAPSPHGQPRLDLISRPRIGAPHVAASARVSDPSAAGFPHGLGLVAASAMFGLLSACGGGGGGGGGSSLNITTCSLGCTVGATNQASCGVTDVFVNQEIRVSFTRDIDQASVNNNTFQVADVATGKVPAAVFSIDPNDARILIFRPQLTFDSSGNPIFGLTENATYAFKIPGQSLDQIGPYIESSSGSSNQTRLLCTLEATRGIFDAKPGPPRASVFVDVVASFDSEGEPDVIDFDVDASGAMDVWRSSDVLLTFDDIMNPATLVNPITGVSNTLRILLDPDGDISDPSDQVELPGEFSIAIDQEAQTTTVTFTPDGGFPSSGSDPLARRRIVVDLPSTIQDLGGNSLINAGQVFFTPESIVFDPIGVVEDFESNTREDSAHTGSVWNDGGLLLSGQTQTGGVLGGGSGRLGDLLVRSGDVIVLNTDFEDFSDASLSDPATYDPRLVIDPILFGQPLSVTGGVFNFASLQIDSGGLLRFEGSNPARILVRGEVIIEGTLDVSGRDGADQDSLVFLGGLGGGSGAGGGLGGDGGARPDGEAFANEGGDDNPNDPLIYDEVNGQAGGGIPFPNTLAPVDFVANGEGGFAHPQPTLADPGFHFPVDPLDISGMQFENRQRCAVIGPGGVGEGGAYSLNGTEGTYIERLGGLNQDDPFTPPPSFGGGDASELMIGDAERSLSPILGFLRGGSGGGGGGAHLQGSRNNGQILNDCLLSSGGALALIEYLAHSSAGGGGGGGGLQLQAGRRIVQNGIVDGSGGDGGSFLIGSEPNAQPGGGGSGPGILLQAPDIQIQNVPGRFNIRGGVGGLGANNSLGGTGSPGLIRLENFGVALDLNTEASKILPSIAELVSEFGVGPEAILSTELWSPSGIGPAGLSGAQSCWIRPTGNFFTLDLAADDPITGVPGWDMTLIIDGFANPQSYRGENDLFNDTLENTFGTLLGSAPVVVRFQGARVAGVLASPCDVLLNGTGSPILPGSLTGWVDHPNKLNTFFGEDSSPNIVRFTVIWDVTQISFAGIRGIEELTFSAQPN